MKGFGFGFASFAMIEAAGVEIYRVKMAHSRKSIWQIALCTFLSLPILLFMIAVAGNYSDVRARENVSPCQVLDDYNPEIFYDWYSGESTDKPLHCQQS
jgi:hypothetical protein